MIAEPETIEEIHDMYLLKDFLMYIVLSFVFRSFFLSLLFHTMGKENILLQISKLILRNKQNEKQIYLE